MLVLNIKVWKPSWIHDKMEGVKKKKTLQVSYTVIIWVKVLVIEKSRSNKVKNKI